MNNFLRGFGNFKKNENGITEYVDYLGVKYTFDPTTKKWKSNGQVLNERQLFNQVLSQEEGIGTTDAGDESGGGNRLRSTQIEETQQLSFSFNPSGTTLENPFINFRIYDGGPSGGYAPPLYDHRNGNDRFMIDYYFFIRKPSDTSYHVNKYTASLNDGIIPYVFPASSDSYVTQNGITYIQTNNGTGNAIRKDILASWLEQQSQLAFGQSIQPGTTLPVVFDFETWFDYAFNYGNSGDVNPLSDAQIQDTILDINPSYAGSTLIRIVQGPINQYATNEISSGITYIKDYFGDDIKISLWAYPRTPWYLQSFVSPGLNYSPAQGWTSDSNYFPYASTQGNTHYSYFFQLSDYATDRIPADKQAAELARYQQEALDLAYYQFLKAFKYTDFISVFNYQVLPTTETFVYYDTDGYPGITLYSEYTFLTEKLYRDYDNKNIQVAKLIAGTTYAKPTVNDIDQDVIPTRSLWYHDTILFYEKSGSSILNAFPLFVPKTEQIYHLYNMRQTGANAMQFWGVSDYFWNTQPTTIRRDIIYNVFGLTFDENNQEYWFPTIAGICGIPDLATSTWEGSTAQNFFTEIWNNYTYDIVKESKTILSDIFPIRETGAITPTDIQFQLQSKSLATDSTFLGVTCHVRFMDQANYTPLIDFAFNPGTITNGAVSEIGSIPVDNNIAYKIDSWVEGIPVHDPLVEAIHGFTFNVLNVSSNNSNIGTFHLTLDYEEYG